MTRAERPTQEWLLRQIGLGPGRELGPNWRVVDGLAHHVNDRPTDPGLPVVLGDDGMWRLA